MQKWQKLNLARLSVFWKQLLHKYNNPTIMHHLFPFIRNYKFSREFRNIKKKL